MIARLIGTSVRFSNISFTLNKGVFGSGVYFHRDYSVSVTPAWDNLCDQVSALNIWHRELTCNFNVVNSISVLITPLWVFARASAGRVKSLLHMVFLINGDGFYILVMPCGLIKINT
jgi:hypothetical protein